LCHIEQVFSTLCQSTNTSEHAPSALKDIAHNLDLAVFLGNIILIDADSIYPDKAIFVYVQTSLLQSVDTVSANHELELVDKYRTQRQWIAPRV
jgi:hypothetical protein